MQDLCPWAGVFCYELSQAVFWSVVLFSEEEDLGVAWVFDVGVIVDKSVLCLVLVYGLCLLGGGVL